MVPTVLEWLFTKVRFFAYKMYKMILYFPEIKTKVTNKLGIPFY